MFSEASEGIWKVMLVQTGTRTCPSVDPLGYNVRAFGLSYYRRYMIDAAHEEEDENFGPSPFTSYSDSSASPSPPLTTPSSRPIRYRTGIYLLYNQHLAQPHTALYLIRPFTHPSAYPPAHPQSNPPIPSKVYWQYVAGKLNCRSTIGTIER